MMTTTDPTLNTADRYTELLKRPFVPQEPEPAISVVDSPPTDSLFPDETLFTTAGQLSQTHLDPEILRESPLGNTPIEELSFQDVLKMIREKANPADAKPPQQDSLKPAQKVNDQQVIERINVQQVLEDSRKTKTLEEPTLETSTLDTTQLSEIFTELAEQTSIRQKNITDVIPTVSVMPVFDGKALGSAVEMDLSSFEVLANIVDSEPNKFYVISKDDPMTPTPLKSDAKFEDCITFSDQKNALLEVGTAKESAPEKKSAKKLG